MGFLNALLRQTATYWAPASVTKFDKFGDPIFATPVTLEYSEGTGVRWEDRVEQFIDTAGEIAHSKAWVWSTTTQFVVGGYLFEGETSETNPETAGGDQIRRVETTPDIKNNKVLYKAIL